MNKHNGAEIGILVEIERSHSFPNGEIDLGYLIQRPDLTYLWMAGEVVERIGRRSGRAQLPRKIDPARVYPKN